MKILRKKTKTAAFALVLLMASVMLTFYTPVQAQLAEEQPYSGPLQAGDVPDYTVATKAYLSVRPTLVGLNQLILVNIWVIPAPNADKKFLDLKVTITKPDTTQQVVTMDSYVADGTSWFEWQANQLGTWKFKYDFPGMYFPAGRYLLGNIINATTGGSNYPQSVYYQPSSSPEMTITVQQDIVYSWPEMPLPTDYWTRPVPYEYREWWPIAGDFPWRGPGGGPMWDELYPNTNPYWGGYSYTGMGGPWRGTFTPWVQGPNSAHVAWKQQYAIGGIVGGDFGVEIADVTLFSGSGVGRFPTIVYSGRAYMYLSYDPYARKDVSKPGSGKTLVPYWQCYDYRTGKLIWERPLEEGESAPTVIEYFDTGLLPGGSTTGIHEHVTAINFLSISDGYLRKYDPWTGAMVANVSIAPMTGSGGTYYRNGYVLGVQDLGGGNYRLINWTTQGTTTNFSNRVVGNITWPWRNLPDTTDYNVGISASVSKSFVGGAPDKTSIRAASLKTGAELWNITIDEWEYSGSCNYADHGKIAVLTEQGYFVAYNLDSGTLAWKSEEFAYPWDYPGYGGYNVLSVYGLLYRNAYTGIYAFNWTNGKIAWKYTAPAAATFETPYVDENGQTVYSTNIGGAIADGKYYIYNTEHSATVPITRGWQLHCINATTGKGIWKVGLPGGGSKHTTDIGPIADGYLSLGGSDGYMYVFGKGRSATTVTASPEVIAKGSSVLIKGTVLDQSPAQPGTPCVSKESMALQMEYLHKQMPIDGIWHNETITGVPVALVAIGSDGKVIDIGTVKTNGYYGTFSHAWTPPDEDTYEIIAAFAGDDSYGSSAAATAVSVGPAPEAPSEPEPEKAADYTPMFLGIIAAVAVAIIIGIVNLWALRKRS